MSDSPDSYLFNSVEDCCEAHFPYDQSCGFNDPSGVMYYPKYDEATCYEKSFEDFDAGDMDKYVTKSKCCIEKFSSDAPACCQDGEGECVLTGISVYLPNWGAQTCESRDDSLVPDWENSWISNTIEECCKECKYILNGMTYQVRIVFSQTSSYYILNDTSDFSHNTKCGIVDQLVFTPGYSAMECEMKLLSELEAWEFEIYYSLNACCREKFPNYMTSCCEATGAGGCALSGTVQWLPDWINAHCYEKDTNLIEQWEWRWAHKTVDKCCGRCKYD